MADWTDPSTWRDAARYSQPLTELSKALTEARRRGDPHPDFDAIHALVGVLQGQQKTLSDVSLVAGKLVSYTTQAHEERRLEIDAIHDLSKSLRKLTKAVDKLTRRVEKLERKSAKPSRK
ncbi:MAG TPA: hypothetical protein VLJ39_20310 [Tepidisphaeraceae bacterium]|nr:hypothetical protein [Tepidisphaeraceae bacterium]